ncbi:MAG: IS1380 family transposase, partial [Armatimonadota bacterium]
MSTHCDIQHVFSFRHDKQFCYDFNAGRISSDAGLSVLREFDHRIGFTASIVECLHDSRNPMRVIHTIFVLVVQRLYALIAGYEDQNDATRLRHDPLFQLIAGKAHLGDALASQPTLSRFENDISAREIGALNDLLVETFISNIGRPPLLVIELDSTDDPAHGQQQLIKYNGFHGQWMYHPLVIHDGVTGAILGTFLRPGNAHSAESALIALRPIIARLKKAFPHTPIYLRADIGFAGPKLYEYCESQGIDFVIAAASTAVYKRRSDDLLAYAVALSKAAGRKVKLYDHFVHQA